MLTFKIILIFHVRRVNDPWLFGLKQGFDPRYYYVQGQHKHTLLLIIKHECADLPNRRPTLIARVW